MNQQNEMLRPAHPPTALLLGSGTGVLLLLCALLVRLRPVRVWCEGVPWSPQPVQGALAVGAESGREIRRRCYPW
ncbi:hypothetical protein [Saccharopolyspora antimicrobica]|uniref:hypothetical protein n=1 Tax=Saccharopolyspora antimicrobica TaxID=455193 RepID=UPI0011601300|nr:hypothetical protein [Saccharopolyspora antimicrobica]